MSLQTPDNLYFKRKRYEIIFFSNYDNLELPKIKIIHNCFPSNNLRGYIVDILQNTKF